MARTDMCGGTYGLAYSKRTKEECDMGVTLLDKNNARNLHSMAISQHRIAKALEQIAKVLEENTCNNSNIGHNIDSNIHPGHEPQTGAYDH